MDSKAAKRFPFEVQNLYVKLMMTHNLKKVVPGRRNENYNIEEMLEFIATCPLTTARPENKRRNGICERSDMDVLILAELLCQPESKEKKCAKNSFKRFLQTCKERINCIKVEY